MHDQGVTKPRALFAVFHRSCSARTSAAPPCRTTPPGSRDHGLTYTTRKAIMRPRSAAPADGSASPSVAHAQYDLALRSRNATDLHELLESPTDRRVAGELWQHPLQLHHKATNVRPAVPGVGVVVLHPSQERVPVDYRHAAKEDGVVNRLLKLARWPTHGPSSIGVQNVNVERHECRTVIPAHLAPRQRGPVPRAAAPSSQPVWPEARRSVERRHPRLPGRRVVGPPTGRDTP
jgi:hypothetical protein